jgi:antirestriction protein ArdC
MTKQTDRKERQTELLKNLHAEIETLTQGERWLEWLRFSVSLRAVSGRRYSFNNQMLAFMQRPDAQYLAGFKAWQAQGRQVRKGSKAISILGFRTFEKDVILPNGKPGKETVPYFPPVSVFDVSDTDPIEGASNVFDPDAQQTLTVRLDGSDEAGHFDMVAQWLQSEGWSVARETIPGTSNGFTRNDGSKSIVVSDEISDAQAVKTLIHEAAHMVLHVKDDGTPAVDYSAHRGVCEIEAESVAYVVAALLGLDTSAYSVGYVAQWAEANLELISSTGENVTKAVNKIAEGLGL